MKRVNISSEKTVFNSFFKLIEVRHSFEKFNGRMSDETVRFVFERGDSCAAVIYNTVSEKLIFTNQFRLPVFMRTGSGWILELVAGSISQGESPEDTMIREVEEEIGYEVQKTTHIGSFFVSPGGTTERIHLYYIEVSPDQKVFEGGGLVEENEDIQIAEFSPTEAIRKVNQQEIVDAKTIIGIQWFKEHAY
jgi:nudix-type nucleoside diphosphatase (YffH/AdpP family)